MVLCAGRCDTSRKAAPEANVCVETPIDTFNALLIHAKANAIIVAAEFRAELNQLRAQKDSKKIQVVHPYDGHIYFQNQNNSQ